VCDVRSWSLTKALGLPVHVGGRRGPHPPCAPPLRGLSERIGKRAFTFKRRWDARRIVFVDVGLRYANGIHDPVRVGDLEQRPGIVVAGLKAVDRKRRCCRLSVAGGSDDLEPRLCGENPADHLTQHSGGPEQENARHLGHKPAESSACAKGISIRR
jgi:hypothetical protein